MRTSSTRSSRRPTTPAPARSSGEVLSGGAWREAPPRRTLLVDLHHLVGQAARVRLAEAGVDRVEPVAELVDRRRDAEAWIGDALTDHARCETRGEPHDGDRVVLVLHDVERLPVEQDAVAV